MSHLSLSQHLTDGHMDHSQVQQELRLRLQACQNVTSGPYPSAVPSRTIGGSTLPVGSSSMRGLNTGVQSAADGTAVTLSAAESSRLEHRQGSGTTSPSASAPAAAIPHSGVAPHAQPEGLQVDAARLCSCGLYAVDAASACKGLPTLLELQRNRGRAVPVETRRKMAQDVPAPVYTGGNCVISVNIDVWLVR
jgi:hypothetical protein